jgi:hypothetical protein
MTLAGYYLRALEQCERNLESPGVDYEPELGGVLDRSDPFNLEHVMPQSSPASNAINQRYSDWDQIKSTTGRLS